MPKRILIREEVKQVEIEPGRIKTTWIYFYSDNSREEISQTKKVKQNEYNSMG